jgi:hypothetical protein
MNILIPVDNNTIDNAEITLIDDVRYWVLLEFFDGKVTKSNFFSSKGEIEEFIDVVILKTSKEDLWQFMEQNIAVLIAPVQESIEDIMEAYIFKELHEANVQY